MKAVAHLEEVPPRWLEAALHRIEQTDFAGSARVAEMVISVMVSDAVVGGRRLKRIRYAPGLGNPVEVNRHLDTGEVFVLLEEGLKELYQDRETGPTCWDRRTRTCFLAAQLIHAAVWIIGESSIHWDVDIDPHRINLRFASHLGELSFLRCHEEDFQHMLALAPRALERGTLLSLYRDVAAFSGAEEFVRVVFADLGDRNPIKGYLVKKDPHSSGRLKEVEASFFVFIAQVFKQDELRDYVLSSYEILLGEALKKLTGHPSISELLNDLDGHHWSDWGCGNGDALLDMNRRVKQRGRPLDGTTLTGVDLEVPPAHEGVEFICSDVQHCRLETRADLITMVFLLWQTYDPIRVIVNAYNQLNTGGVLLGEAYQSTKVIHDH